MKKEMKIGFYHFVRGNISAAFVYQLQIHVIDKHLGWKKYLQLMPGFWWKGLVHILLNFSHAFFLVLGDNILKYFAYVSMKTELDIIQIVALGDSLNELLSSVSK